MKRRTDDSKASSLARKRALIRSLIEQTGWAGAAVAPSRAPATSSRHLRLAAGNERPASAPQAQLAQIIPFPASPRAS